MAESHLKIQGNICFGSLPMATDITQSVRVSARCVHKDRKSLERRKSVSLEMSFHSLRRSTCFFCAVREKTFYTQIVVFGRGGSEEMIMDMDCCRLTVRSECCAKNGQKKVENLSLRRESSRSRGV